MFNFHVSLLRLYFLSFLHLCLSITWGTSSHFFGLVIICLSFSPSRLSPSPLFFHSPWTPPPFLLPFPQPLRHQKSADTPKHCTPRWHGNKPIRELKAAFWLIHKFTQLEVSQKFHPLKTFNFAVLLWTFLSWCNLRSGPDYNTRLKNTLYNFVKLIKQGGKIYLF